MDAVEIQSLINACCSRTAKATQQAAPEAAAEDADLDPERAKEAAEVVFPWGINISRRMIRR
jgi:tRNA A37 N6-isopentenylltransferase MiaA